MPSPREGECRSFQQKILKTRRTKSSKPAFLNLGVATMFLKLKVFKCMQSSFCNNVVTSNRLVAQLLFQKIREWAIPNFRIVNPARFFALGSGLFLYCGRNTMFVKKTLLKHN